MMNRRASLILAAIACSLFAGGCTAAMLLQDAKYRFLSDEEVNLLDINYAAADYIVGQARGSLTSNSIVLSKPLTESQNPIAPSKFGKVIPEQVAARMVQLGYKVRASNDVPETRRHFILTGTYLTSETNVTVSLRLLDSATDQMMGAYDYVIPINEDIDALLQPQPAVMRVSQ